MVWAEIANVKRDNLKWLLEHGIIVFMSHFYVIRTVKFNLFSDF